MDNAYVVTKEDIEQTFQIICKYSIHSFMDELSYIEMECPNCGDLVDIDEELLFDDSVDVICPNCQAIILSSEEDEEGCSGCGCGCEDHDEK